VDPVDDKATLVAMLGEAAELEHGLCCQYLYAAFTLKRAGEPGVSAAQAELAAQWEQQVTKVAVQEMYHLLLANNLLTALGAAPHLWRANFPQPPSAFSDIDLPSVLAPFDLDTVSRFLCWEKPETSGWWDDECAALAQRLRALAGAGEPAPRYSSIGQLYEEIKAALYAHPDWIDPGQADKQVTSELVPFSPKVTPITTPAQAAGFIDVIVSEGEGTGDYDAMSHFAYYHQIVQQLKALGGSAPGRSTVLNPIYDAAHETAGTSLVSTPAVNAVGRLFSDLYLLMLEALGRVFAPEGEDPDQRRALANAAMALMPLVLKPLGILLTRLPAGDDTPGLYAGPSFELPQAVAPPAGEQEAAWEGLRGRLADLAGRCRILSLEPEGLTGEASGELGRIAARLETLVPLLDAEAVRR
jgi:Ferritin-like